MPGDAPTKTEGSDAPFDRPPDSPLFGALAAWIGGTLAARYAEPGAGFWWAAIAVACAAALWAWRRNSRLLTAALLAAIACTAGLRWHAHRQVHTAGLQLSSEPILLDVEGVIEREPRVRTPEPRSDRRLDLQPPHTAYILRVDRLRTEASWHPVRFKLWVGMPAYETRRRLGDRVRCIGWASRFEPPLNPGEYDVRESMRLQGVLGRLRLRVRGNCRPLAAPGPAATWLTWRHRLIRGAQRALLEGLPAHEPPTALLRQLVLGSGREDLGELDEAFRHTGLAHLLAVSGLHVGILALGVGWLARTLIARPAAGPIAALAAVLFYVLIIPPRVPILRAGLMVAVGCLALARGRRLSTLPLVALAALVLLCWRPHDLFSAGFQLSFAIVAGLIRFTPAVSRMIRPEPTLKMPGRARTLQRWAADSMAVSLVAWLIAMPLIAHHFHTLSPMGAPLTLLCLPAVAVLLWTAFAKILLGALWPAAGLWMAGPLRSMAESFADAVVWSSQWPGVVATLPPTGPWWALTALAVILAALQGRFARRPAALFVSVLLLGAWLHAPAIVSSLRKDIALSVTMLAVGDGSCYVVRSGPTTWVFDCGSGRRNDLVRRTVGPALRALGVRRVDTLVISHPDVDHHGAAADLAEAFGIRRVLLGPGFVQAAEAEDDETAASLLKRLRAHGVRVRTVARGWSETLDRGRVEVLWPPRAWPAPTHNDGSIVMRFSAAGRRVMLCGDIQQTAMRAMMHRESDLRADVVELPHHGSFVDAAPAWLARVDPQQVLQSTGAERLHHDPWPGHLRGKQRHITALHGCTQVRVHRDRSVKTLRFRQALDVAPYGHVQSGSPPGDGRRERPPDDRHPDAGSADAGPRARRNARGGIGAADRSAARRVEPNATTGP